MTEYQSEIVKSVPMSWALDELSCNGLDGTSDAAEPGPPLSSDKEMERVRFTCHPAEQEPTSRVIG
jgi:hypothetical protein